MELREFHNGMRILLNIESFDLAMANIDRDAQKQFLEDPLRFFIRCDDETADKLWAIIERRNAKRAA